MKRLKLFLQELRAPFFTASIIPVVLGTVIAWRVDGILHSGYFLLTLIGGVCLHAGTNIANDYFDHISGNDEVNTEYIRPFTGGSRLIQQKLLTPAEVLGEALFFFAIGILIGLYLVFTRGLPILYLGIFGVISGFFYVYPKFGFASLGIGEMVVGLNFGVLMVMGSYFVQTQSFGLTSFFATIPVALLIAAVLYINEFPDYSADKAVGKNHLVVRLGRERAVLGYNILMWLVYIIILLGIFIGIIPVWAFAALLTIPIFIKASGLLKKYYDNPKMLMPANAATIQLHLIIGLVLIVSYLIK